jgi:DNA polymerase elongation subunit (family B)
MVYKKGEKMEDLVALSDDNLVSLYLKTKENIQTADTRQYTKKISINSIYGAVANTVMNIANSDLAGGITSYGRYNLKKTTLDVVKKLNDLNPNFKIHFIQQDTDSKYLCFDSVVQEYTKTRPNATDADIVEFLDQFCKKTVAPIIKGIATEIATECNAREDEIYWDREVIASRFISSGKKKYACLVLDDEGTRLSEPKKKIVGLEIKRSSTPSDVKIALGNIIDLIFEGDNQKLVNFIEEYKVRYSTLDINTVAIPIGVSEIDKFIEDDTLTMPWHVRASTVYNNFIDASGLDYTKIVNGDKIKIVYLRKNPITTSETMAFLDSRFLTDSGLIEYIDFNIMFQKSFMSPVESLTKIVRWKTSLNDTLMELF